MVRAAQKGEGAASPEVAKVAGEISKKDAKDFAKTKHKGLPEKKKVDEAVKGQDTESRKEGAKERATEKKAHDAWKKSGVGKTKRPLYSTTRHTKGDAESYADQQKQSIKWHDKRTKGKFIPGTTSESFEIDKSAHKKVQRQAKIRNLAKGNKNPNEKEAAERKLKGPKLAWEEFKTHI